MSPEPPDSGSIRGKRSWIYALNVKGHYQQVHRWTGRALQAILFIVPWLTVGGRPAVRMDLPARRLYAFGQMYTAQDTILLVLLGLAAAFSLFLFTALYGRLWCGYACPQTVFLEEWVRPIELWFEGDRSVRMARDKLPWSRSIGGAKLWDKAWRRAASWTGYAAVAGLVAMAFMSWFVGARVLWSGQADAVSYGITGLLAAGMFLDFAWFREQFCNYLCPYARFQGALTDTESLVIAYDSARGEPRRGLRPAPRAARPAAHDHAHHDHVHADAPLLRPIGVDGAGAVAFDTGTTSGGGSCVDCKRCVVVCPQGIDIRSGFQLECISCARCVDACDDVFAKLRTKNPDAGQGLISYSAVAPGSMFRPRTIAYAVLLCVVLGSFGALVARHHDITANLDRAPGMLFTIDPDGYTRNTYLLQVTNNKREDLSYVVRVDGVPAGAEVNVPPVSVAGGKTVTVPVIVRIPPGSSGARTVPLTVSIAAGDDRVTLSTTFKASEG